MTILETLILAEKILNGEAPGFLVERYSTNDTRFSYAARTFFYECCKECEKRVNINRHKIKPTSYYGYFVLRIEELSKSQETRRIVYEGRIDVKNRSINISVELGNNETKNQGITLIEKNSIIIYILPREYNEISRMVKQNVIPYRMIKNLMLSKRSTLVHELVHYFQNVSGELNKKEVKKSNEMEKNLRLSLLQKYHYLFQEHEIKARLTQANKLYKDKSNLGENGRIKSSI